MTVAPRPENQRSPCVVRTTGGQWWSQACARTEHEKCAEVHPERLTSKGKTNTPKWLRGRDGCPAWMCECPCHYVRRALALELLHASYLRGWHETCCHTRAEQEAEGPRLEEGGCNICTRVSREEAVRDLGEPIAPDLFPSPPEKV